MSREVVFAPEALADLCKLFDDITLDAGTGRAQSYTDRIVAHGLVSISSRNGEHAATVYDRVYAPPHTAAASPSHFISQI